MPLGNDGYRWNGWLSMTDPVVGGTGLLRVAALPPEAAAAGRFSISFVRIATLLLPATHQF